MSGDFIDVSEQVNALLCALGFPDKTIVKEVRVGPTEATVLYYPRDAAGSKEVLADGHTATRWRTFKVRT